MVDDFGARLREWRQARLWTILRTANHVRINPSTIYRIEKGLSGATAATRRKIAKRIPELAQYVRDEPTSANDVLHPTDATGTDEG